MKWYERLTSETIKNIKNAPKRFAKDKALSKLEESDMGEFAVGAYKKWDKIKGWVRKHETLYRIFIWLVSNPLGWVILLLLAGVLVSATVDILDPLWSSSDKENHQEMVNKDKREKYLLLFDECPPEDDVKLGEGSGPGDWKVKGTDNYMRAKYVFEKLVSYGLPNTTAAAAIGNASVESGSTFHPAVVESIYHHMYTHSQFFPSLGNYLAPDPGSFIGDSSSNIGKAGYGIFQESPGKLLKERNGTNKYVYRNEYSTGEDWTSSIFDVKPTEIGITTELHYFFLVKSGAGMSATGLQGLKSAALKKPTVTNAADGYIHDFDSDILNPSSIESATRGWFWWFEIGNLNVAEIAGIKTRIKNAQIAYDLFHVSGREHYDEERMKKVGEDESSDCEYIDTDGEGGHSRRRGRRKKRNNIDRSDIVKLATSLVGYWSYSQPNRTSIIPTLNNPTSGVGQTDCSGFVWAVYKMAGYKVTPYMWATMSMYADAYGPQNYLELIPASEAKAGDAIVHDPGGTGAGPAHTAIIMEDWKGLYNTRIVQEGGMGNNVNAGDMAYTSIAEPYFFVRPKYKVGE